MNSWQPKLRALSVNSIENSSQINEWLSLFDESEKPIAKTLLTKLRFVSRDDYSHWLRQTIENFDPKATHALYSVRKLNDGKIKHPFWDTNGVPFVRPHKSQGSEDLVYSLISNIVRANPSNFYDHPSLHKLKEENIRNYILIDDSVGSGDRVSDFINNMLDNPTFLSWWSLGWIKLTIVCFAIPDSSKNKIIGKIRGSDHGLRKYPKSSKISFVSHFVYNKSWLSQRWGDKFREIIELCKNKKKVQNWARLGYGDILSNLVFYHSVPNNIPGILWFQNTKWQGLMPGRAIPSWLIDLLQTQENGSHSGKNHTLSEDLLTLLVMSKKGVRRPSSIALRLGVDTKYASELIRRAKNFGLLTDKGRLTKTGLNKLVQSKISSKLPSWDYSMYIPSSWCADQENIQPSADTSDLSTDSAKVEAFADGDAGEVSLGRSDAKAAEPPFNSVPQEPSEPREMHGTDGPKGSKER